MWRRGQNGKDLWNALGNVGDYTGEIAVELVVREVTYEPLTEPPFRTRRPKPSHPRQADLGIVNEAARGSVRMAPAMDRPISRNGVQPAKLTQLTQSSRMSI